MAYTGNGGPIVIEEYLVSGNPDVADPASGVVIYGPYPHPQSNHNGGQLQFGPDGYLYFGHGDGGGANDTGSGHAAGGNAQSPTTDLGKILRLDADTPGSTVPPSNPFASPTDGINDLIWAFGVRNPWRFSFDRATGDLYIGDVGQGAREEVDFQPAASAGGENYGWRCMEGTRCTGLTGCTCNDPALTLPIHEYSHAFGCSITGGYVYRGVAIPAAPGHTTSSPTTAARGSGASSTSTGKCSTSSSARPISIHPARPRSTTRAPSARTATASSTSSIRAAARCFGSRASARLRFTTA